MSQKLAIFISGYGSNLKSVLDHFPNRKPYIYANKECSGLSWARRRGCFTQVLSLKNEQNWSDLAHELNDLKIKRVLLLGFMKIIPAHFLSEFKGEIINLHPSLLPSYPGLKSIEKAFNDGADLGASIHKVTEGVDEGPVLLQRKASTETDYKTSKQNVHFVEQRIVCKYLNLVSF